MHPALSSMRRGALPLLLTLGASALPAWADSSSMSSVASTSVGSVSTSLENSSDSASPRQQAAQGDYTVVAVIDLPDQPTHQRVRLAMADAPMYEVQLRLPRAAAERGQLVPGGMVRVAQRAYGVALARAHDAQAQAPFFLVLNDDWFRELDSRALVL